MADECSGLLRSGGVGRGRIAVSLCRARCSRMESEVFSGRGIADRSETGETISSGRDFESIVGLGLAGCLEDAICLESHFFALLLYYFWRGEACGKPYPSCLTAGGPSWVRRVSPACHICEEKRQGETNSGELACCCLAKRTEL